MNNYLPVSVISYAIGNVSGSFLVGRLFKNKDIRNYGSGNAGTTNAFRVLGKKLGVLTFLIDFLKGIFAAFIALKFYGREYIPLAILFAVIGHDFPFWMKFKGGKGVATTLGGFAFYSFKLTLLPYLIWLFLAVKVKIISVASIAFLIALMIFFSFFGHLNLQNILITNLICIIGIFQHRSNIKRLIEGNENVVGGKK